MVQLRPRYRTNLKPRKRLVALLTASAFLVVAGCGGSDSDDAGSGGTQAADCQPTGGQVKLTYWTWAPGVAEAAKVWNQKNPDIQVAVEEVPQGNNGTYPKMFNALKAGKAPDLGQVEFDSLPSFRVQQGLRDIAKCPGVAEAGPKFVDWTWKQATFSGDGVYAVPQDTGPMAMYYRKDLFAKYGIDVPKTWEEYAAAAAKLHAADPSLTITHFPQKDVNWFAGLVWQAGGRWFSDQGGTWKVDLTDANSKKVATYWQDLIGKGQVANLQGFSEAWNNAMNTGKVATWISAVWGIGTIRDAAPKTAGKWAVAPMPQWTTGESKAGNWGGSTTAVLAGSQHPAEAAKFALWLNTDPEALAITNTEGGLYPATTEGQSSLPGLSQPNPFFGGQKVFDEFRTASAQVDPDFTWGPTMEQTYAHLRDGFGAALAGKSTLEQAMTTAAQDTVKDLEQQAIPVQK
jgi:multiple sugar transport system substrate-binding protein